MDATARMDSLRSAAWILLAVLTASIWYALLDFFLGGATWRVAGVSPAIVDGVAAIVLGVLTPAPVWLARRVGRLQWALVVVTIVVIMGWLLIGVLAFLLPAASRGVIGLQMRLNPPVLLVRGVASALSLATWFWIAQQRAPADGTPDAVIGSE
jgi:hypothetical protein